MPNQLTAALCHCIYTYADLVCIGRLFTLNTAALHLVFGDCKSICRVDLHRCKCSGTRLLSAGLAQQHRRTRQAVHPKPCSTALVFGDCTPVCRVDLHICKNAVAQGCCHIDLAQSAQKNKAGSLP